MNDNPNHPKSLAIAMPTRNRAMTVKTNILGILDELKRYHVEIYLSDDSIGNETETMVHELQLLYEGIHYSKNEPPLGHDANCLKVIVRPQTDYIWYLGDAMIIQPGAIEKIYQAIQNDCSFVFLNRQYLSLHLGYSGNIPDFQSFLDTNVWHLTLTSATVYSKNALELGLRNYRVGDSTNFAQLGLILNAIRNGCHDGYWLGDRLTKTNTAGTKSYWMKRTIPVFAGDWTHMIRSYSDVFSKNKFCRILKSHSRKTGILGFFNLCKLGICHGLGEDNRKYFEDVCTASCLPRWMVRLFIKPEITNQ